MKIIVVFSIMLYSLLPANLTAQSNIASQDYKTAFGVKFYPGAVTIKHFLNDKTGIEGLSYFWTRGARVTGLYEFHWNIPNATGLKWYAGPGAHVGFNKAKFGGGSTLGVDGVIGMDYKFKGAPINLSLDWQPSFEFGNTYGYNLVVNWGGLAIRYVF